MTDETDKEIGDLIAIEILEWELYESPSREGKFWYDKGGIGLPYIHEEYWNPLKVLGQAFFILEKKFKYPEYEWAITNTSEGYCVRISHIRDKSVNESDYRGEELPETICRCCLSAKGIEI